MKSCLLLTLAPSLLLGNCNDLPGYAGHSGASSPQCFLDAAGQGTLIVSSATRLNWNNLKVGGSSTLQGLSINSGGQPVVIVDSGNVNISGPLSATGRLGIFASNIFVGGGGSITAPTLLLSALSPASADAWLATGSTEVAESTQPNTGSVQNRGVVTASVGDLTVLGTTVQNEARFGDAAVLESTHGALRITAAGRASLTPTSTTALAQSAVRTTTINNYGTMRGYTVHLNAVPRYVPGLPVSEFIILNEGTVASRAGVNWDTRHPTLPVTGQSATGPNSLIITPNSSTWQTSSLVHTVAHFDGPVIEPSEDDVAARPTPIALPKFSTDTVASTNSAAPPLAATYSSLNALPKPAPGAVPVANPSLVATRGATEKKPRKALFKGAFFSLQYHGER